MRSKIKLHSITKNLFPEYFQFHLRITGKFDKAFALACNKSPQNSNMYFFCLFSENRFREKHLLSFLSTGNCNNGDLPQHWRQKLIPQSWLEICLTQNCEPCKSSFLNSYYNKKNLTYENKCICFNINLNRPATYSRHTPTYREA